ncbi:MAG: ATP-binding protein [Smithellaceae bacterium]
MNEIYQNELARSKIYSLLKCKCDGLSDGIGSSVIKLVNEVVSESCELSKTIIKYMPEYTLHDETHLFRVLSIMERLIPISTLNSLSIPELMMLILVSFLHDIGMAPEEEKIRSWKKIWTNQEPSKEELDEFNHFNRFRNTFPYKIIEIDKLRSNGEHQKANLIEDYIISEYIRNTHAVRAREIIAAKWADKIVYEDKNLTYELTQLCFSHGNDALSLLDLETNVLCAENSYMCMPFIGVIIRLADLLDFDAKRTPTILFSHLSVRNPVSLKEWQKHRSIKAWVIKPEKIAYTAQCSHPAIEKSINVFCDLIDKELSNCSNVLSRISDDFRDDVSIYKITLPAKVDRRKIQPEIDIKTNEPRYIYKDTSFELSKEQIIDLLMGTKLYSDTKSALRELIQNSIDACLVAQALCNKFGILYSPEIIVRYYSEGTTDILEVEDNGIGMNQSIIEKYYAKVGSSYYKSKEFYDLKAQTGLTFQPISRFGIGILSCFMVSDTIEVETRKLLDNGDKDSSFEITIEGYDSIFTLRAGKRVAHGTKTRLFLRQKENPWDKIRSEKFVEYVIESIPNPPVLLRVEVDKNENKPTIIDQTSFSLISPNSLRDYRWRNEDCIREVEIVFDDIEKGIKGSGIIALFEDAGQPVNVIEHLQRTVRIDDEDYTLENKIILKENEIEKTRTVIEVGIDSGIDTKNSTDSIVKSRSKFSIHGIDFPDGLFPDFSSRSKKAKLRWYLPMLLVIDILGNNDIDLNSARTEIVYNEKWNKFESELAKIIIDKLKEQLSETYWMKLREILVQSNSSVIFIELVKQC